MNTVWIVEQCVPDQCIIGVYSSLEKAKASQPKVKDWEDEEGVLYGTFALRAYTITHYKVD